MNIYQRIVLILGSIVLILAIWTTPRVAIVRQGILRYEKSEHKRLAPIIEPRTALMRSIAVMGATILVFFALKKGDKP